MRKLLPAVLCALAVAGCDARPDEPASTSRDSGSPSGAAPPPQGDGRVDAGEIRAPGLREHLRALQEIAETNDDNRAAGTPGDEASVEYVEEQLREAGWRVSRQPVSFPYFDERSPPRLNDLREGDDFRTLSYSSSSRVEGPVRRLGLGCARGDFRALEEGQIALVARGECFFRDKARNAEAAGAAALLVADGESDEPPSATLGARGSGSPCWRWGPRAGARWGRARR